MAASVDFAGLPPLIRSTLLKNAISGAIEKKPPAGSAKKSRGFDGASGMPNSAPAPEQLAERADRHQREQEAQSHAGRVPQRRDQRVARGEQLEPRDDDRETPRSASRRAPTWA